MSLRENLAYCKKTFILDRFNQLINGIRSGERGFLTSIKGRNSTFVNCLKTFQRSVGSIGRENGEGI